jgi:hypothetical protein
MNKNTLQVDGGAMPKFDRAAVMTRAWAIFRQTYSYPAIKFSDIGRRCFAGCLRKAWVEAREAARVAALTPEEKADRIESLNYLIQRAGFICGGREWKETISRHRAELRQLQAA